MQVYEEAGLLASRLTARGLVDSEDGHPREIAGSDIDEWILRR